MILSDVFERFSQDSPLSVMAQGVMANAINPQILDQLFEDHARKQFTNKLLFSTVVDLMSVVVCRIRPSIHAAFQGTRRDRRGDHRRPSTTNSTHRDRCLRRAGPRRRHAVGPGHRRHGGARPDWLPGYRTRILDGNHLPGSEHRIKELRTMRAAALPGHALVVLDPG